MVLGGVTELPFLLYLFYPTHLYLLEELEATKSKQTGALSGITLQKDHFLPPPSPTGRGGLVHFTRIWHQPYPSHHSVSSDMMSLPINLL